MTIVDPSLFADVAKFPRHMFSEEFQQTPKGGGPPPPPQLPVILTSEEGMFVEMRDLNFASVGLFLSKEAKKITEQYNVCGWCGWVVCVWVWVGGVWVAGVGGVRLLYSVLCDI